jgi:4-amino-4-deoxy-L-arabinose transferase-like glycosyltransferase
MSRADCQVNQTERWQSGLVLLAACVLLFGGLGTRALWGSEGRWAEITREMFLTGDFFHPSIGGEPYFDKPLLTYWVIAVISALSGTLNELVVRLPSALAGLAAIWATLKLGQRLWSHRVGSIAAILLLTSYGFLFWSRTAAADMENLAAIILAVAWYWYRRERPTFFVFLVFYLILFLGALMKGLPALVLPVIAIFPDIMRERRWRILLRPGHFLALGTGGLLYLIPFVYASLTAPSDYQESGLALVVRENIVRFFKPFDHQGAVYLYVYALPMFLLPWVPLFLGAVISRVRSWNQLDLPQRWLLQAAGLIFLFFTLSGSRRNYYILPILPLCALLMAVFLEGVPAGPPVIRSWSLKLQKLLFLLAAGLLLLSPLALPWIRTRTGFEAPPLSSTASVLVGMSALVVPWLVGRWAKIRSLDPGWAGVVSLAFMGTVIMGGTLVWQQNVLDQSRTERPFALRLKQRLAGYAPERIAFFHTTDAKVSFYLATPEPIRVIDGGEPLEVFLAETRPSILITQQRYAELIPPALLAKLNQAEKLEEESRPWESKSAGNKKWVAWFWPPGASSSQASFMGERASPGATIQP